MTSLSQTDTTEPVSEDTIIAALTDSIVPGESAGEEDNEPKTDTPDLLLFQMDGSPRTFYTIKLGAADAPPEQCQRLQVGIFSDRVSYREAMSHATLDAAGHAQEEAFWSAENTNSVSSGFVFREDTKTSYICTVVKITDLKYAVNLASLAAFMAYETMNSILQLPSAPNQNYQMLATITQFAYDQLIEQKLASQAN